MERPRYWPSTTLVFEKFLLLKKAARRNKSSKLVAMNAEIDIDTKIKVSIMFTNVLCM
jgi:hypothetical protein